MNILYFGNIVDDDVYKKKLEEKLPFFVAQYSYESAIYTELKKDESIDIQVNSIYQSKTFPDDDLWINMNSKEREFYYIPYINLPVIKEFFYFLTTCIRLLKFNKRRGKKVVFSSTHYPPVSLAIVLMSIFLDYEKIVTFTDLSLFSYSERRIKKMKWWKKIIIRPYKNMVDFLQKSYDKYILFSQPMNEIVNPYNKPYIVVEGSFNSEGLNFEGKDKYSGFVITHAGTLNREVGIDKILDVFSLVRGEKYRLLLIGDGDMVDKILEKSKNDKRIQYLGFLDKNQVFEVLKKSHLLVNLRNPNDEYTKHSFPSKMFEYMASGTPVLTTKIDGIPKEYYDYLFSVESYQTEVIAGKIEEIQKLNPEENIKLGELASNFILNCKSPHKQSRKVMDLIMYD